MAKMASKGWGGRFQPALHAVTLVVVVGSLALYGYAALGPPISKPAFVFLVCP